MIREITDGDVDWLRTIFCEHWGGERIVRRDVSHPLKELRGFVAIPQDEESPEGQLAYSL